MKCINKKFMTVTLVTVLCTGLGGCTFKKPVKDYEAAAYSKTIYEAPLYTDDLCVSAKDVTDVDPGFSAAPKAAALFDLEDKKIYYSSELHEKVFPASTTKILTALTAIKYADLEDTVTVSKAGAAESFSIEEQVCGLKEGDKLSLKSLLNGLLLHSGNDAAVAVAEFVGGDVETFMDMMNDLAQEIGATNTHFVTPNGLHDEDHYTTPYDLYLIFNECIKYPEFMNIISEKSYTASITDSSSGKRAITWSATNFYARGEAALPEGADVIGGKTGYTGEAQNCLILLDEDSEGKQYISIVMGAESKPLLYEDMTALINQIPNAK